MAEYIEREALLDKAQQTADYFLVKNILHGVPLADVAPVVHGRWEWLGPYRYNNDGSIGTCSVCHNRTRIFCERNYCPNCGAKMDLENDYE